MKTVTRKQRVKLCNAALRPVSEISDRAKRYRANSSANRPPGEKRCGFCYTKTNVIVGHLNGNEDDGAPDNLMWTCRRCNAQQAALLKREGLGKRIQQKNPARKRGQMPKRQLNAAYAEAIMIMRGRADGDVNKAVEFIRSVPPEVRSAFTARAWKTRKAQYGPSGRSDGGAVPF
jgi:5-methylcytosine-specific restriction endonuclease McrA